MGRKYIRKGKKKIISKKCWTNNNTRRKRKLKNWRGNEHHFILSIFRVDSPHESSLHENPLFVYNNKEKQRRENPNSKNRIRLWYTYMCYCTCNKQYTLYSGQFYNCNTVHYLRKFQKSDVHII